ncbi:MAG TPA: hypothetical protein VK045_11275 [Ornithinicoccus sp.]|nr:hypothetical protein [Ornithinicoccus sp.]
MNLRSLALATTSAAALLFAVPAAGAAGSGGVTDGAAFYIDGVTYRTVATPTDLSTTGAPAHSYDTIYAFPSGEQLNVADAAPGHGQFNGGRWMVHALALPNGYDAAVASGDVDGDGVLDSAAEIEAALATGDAVDSGVVRAFVCTVNRFPQGAS